MKVEFLMLLSGLCWTIVYIEVIRLGFKNKTYGIPLFALALNVCWEGLYSILGSSTPGAQGIVNTVWFSLDLIIVFTFFAYGYRYFPKTFSKKQFFIWGILVFLVAFILELIFSFQFPLESHGEEFSAFLQNFLMSILFINMLVMRPTTAGQSMTIAISKWLGTLAPTIAIYLSINPKDVFHLPDWGWFIVIIGILCSVFDLIYIALLWSRKRKEKAISTV